MVNPCHVPLLLHESSWEGFLRELCPFLPGCLSLVLERSFLGSAASFCYPVSPFFWNSLLTHPVGFFSLPRRIRAGTELTWDYNYEVGSVEGKELLCCCGAIDCRGRLL